MPDFPLPTEAMEAGIVAWNEHYKFPPAVRIQKAMEAAFEAMGTTAERERDEALDNLRQIAGMFLPGQRTYGGAQVTLEKIERLCASVSDG